MNKETEKVYLKYNQMYLDYASEYADYQTEATKNDFYSLLHCEFKKDLNDAVKRERRRLKAINKLYQMKLKAEKRILRLRKGGIDYTPEPSIDEKIREMVLSALTDFENKVPDIIINVLAEFFDIEQNDAVEQPTTDESEPVDEQTEEKQTSETVEEQASDDEESIEVEPDESEIEDGDAPENVEEQPTEKKPPKWYVPGGKSKKQ